MIVDQLIAELQKYEWNDVVSIIPKDSTGETFILTEVFGWFDGEVTFS